MEIKISVVIPTYNRPQLLHNCLRNLINQTFNKNNYEIIVVSDGPDEITNRKVVELQHASSATITFCSLPYKKGPAAARNLGWQKANGILIAFTDDDCLPASDWLQCIWNNYNNEKHIVYTGKVVVPISKHPTDFELNTSGLETGEFVTANCMCTKEALKKIDGFDEKFKAAWREDSDIHFKFLEHNIPVRKNEKAVVVHPVRKATWGVSIKEQKKSMYNALLYKKHPQLYRARIKAQPNWLYYAIVFLFTVAIITMALGVTWVYIIALAGWLLLTARFIAARLKRTSRSIKHVSEMIVTSFAIPFLSIFWTLYGSIKYRVLFF